MEELKKILKSRESIILLYTALGLICIHFIGDIRYIQHTGFRMWMGEGPAAEFKSLAWWTGVNLVFYILFPALIIRYFFKEDPREFGFKAPFKNGNKIYFWFLALMLPLVFTVSFTAAFQTKYPFYQLNQGEKLYPWFCFWECLYFFQFVGLEYFFRGFIVLGLKDKFGLHSVLIMTVPYAMIHFSKPMPEAIGSIFAGIALGYLSYQKRSVIPGAILHFTVAITMDLLALWQKGLL